MPTSLYIGSFFYALISAASAFGQIALTSDKPLAEISYRPVGKLIYVPVQVNGSSALWFIFDTGAPNSLIDDAAARELKVRALSSGVIHGVGKGAVSASDVGEVRFTVASLTTQVAHAKLVDLSKVPLPAKANGLLGAEFLEQYVVRIDPARHNIGMEMMRRFTLTFNARRGLLYLEPNASSAS
jgi:hypothetical protein